MVVNEQMLNTIAKKYGYSRNGALNHLIDAIENELGCFSINGYVYPRDEDYDEGLYVTLSECEDDSVWLGGE
jgi:hypothetical protein